MTRKERLAMRQDRAAEWERRLRSDAWSRCRLSGDRKEPISNSSTFDKRIRGEFGHGSIARPTKADIAMTAKRMGLTPVDA